MRSKTLFCLAVLGLTLPAFAQLDSFTLRAKYGAPLQKEIFTIPSGFDLIVEYEGINQVCKLSVPALMPSSETIRNTDAMRQRMYDFLADLVPASVRGKEAARLFTLMGLTSISTIEYENVTVREITHGNQPLDGTITLTFKNAVCAALK